MSPANASTHEDWFVRWYALANAGGYLCFVPLFSLILPQRAAELAPQASVEALSQILFAGGIAASLANIVAGWISDQCLDRWGSRGPVMVGGLALTLASFVVLARAADLSTLLWALVGFQCAFNLLFAPLTALAADYGSDLSKGRLFGVLSLALPVAQGAATLIALSSLDSIGQRLLAVGLAAVVMIAPLLALAPALRLSPAVPATAKVIAPEEKSPGNIDAGSPGNIALVWVGRIVIQCGSVAISSYLLLHLHALPLDALEGQTPDNMLGKILLLSLAGAICTGPVVGLWSDRMGRRIPFLQSASLCIALGCGLMASMDDWRWIAAGHLLFSIGLTAFLTIDSAIIAQIVGKQNLRATRLGVINLTNTLPSLLVPGAVLVATSRVPVSTGALFLAAGAAALISLLCASRIRGLK